MKGRKFTVAFDVDDVLGVCAQAALDSWCQESGQTFSLYDITGWVGPECPWTKYFADPEFVLNQPVNPGAQRIIRELIHRGVDVMVITAVPMCVASARGEWIKKHFPEIPESNIIMGKRKDICAVDVLVDDAAHNILNSRAKYPILMRKPWNQEVTGVTAVNDFDECLNMIETIMRQSGFTNDTTPTDIICLVGPSGTGKTEVISALHEAGYITPQICTTNQAQAASQSYYKYVERESFQQQKDAHNFVETTSYAGEYYGIRMETIVDIFTGPNKGRKLVIPIDICGANALQRAYGSRVKTVYIKRSRPELVAKILAKDISDQEKALRILALDKEERNESLCDACVVWSSLQQVVDEIRKQK